jgi:hypothetical protein
MTEGDMRIVASSIKDFYNEGGQATGAIDRIELDTKLPIENRESFKRYGESDKK